MGRRRYCCVYGVFGVAGEEVTVVGVTKRSGLSRMLVWDECVVMWVFGFTIGQSRKRVDHVYVYSQCAMDITKIIQSLGLCVGVWRCCCWVEGFGSEDAVVR
jgi:hypothetical protein